MIVYAKSVEDLLSLNKSPFRRPLLCTLLTSFPEAGNHSETMVKCSIIPKTCVFIAYYMKFCISFVLTNTGTRLGQVC